MGYDQYTVPETVAVELSFVAFLWHFQTWSMASRTIFSNFFEEQWTQNHPQYLSGLSRSLFPTTFLETAVNGTGRLVNEKKGKNKQERKKGKSMRFSIS